MITVEYPPGASDPIHRHNALVAVYVLEGTVVMQVRGGRQQTLVPGQAFVEEPDDVHVVGRNASNIKSAKLLVFSSKIKVLPYSFQRRQCTSNSDALKARFAGAKQMSIPEGERCDLLRLLLAKK